MFAGYGLRAKIPSASQGRLVMHDVQAHRDSEAHAAGIIAREARRQYQAALAAAPMARRSAMAGHGTTYAGMGRVLMALAHAAACCGRDERGG